MKPLSFAHIKAGKPLPSFPEETKPCPACGVGHYMMHKKECKDARERLKKIKARIAMIEAQPLA